MTLYMFVPDQQENGKPTCYGECARHGLPLYHFSGDEAPGDTAGQGLNDMWFVLSPEGSPYARRPTTAAARSPRLEAPKAT